MTQSKESFADYEGFVDKFRPKLTTDDCYTPPEVYDVVADYVANRFGLDRGTFVRPFYPGGDFERFDYPEDRVVVDNPPFSILARIKRFYVERDIPFFLFAPSLTILSGMREPAGIDHIVCNACVTYENGAVVRTGFVTNLAPDIAMETAPELGRAVNEACDRLAKQGKRELPKYAYPDDVLTAARAQWLAQHGERLVIKASDCVRISAMDAQREQGKAVFGCGLLLSERAAAERAAAERAAATRWQLSDRERELQRSLG